MAAPLVLRIITDITQTLRATSAASSSMTGVGAAALKMGVDIETATKTAVLNGVRMEEQLAAEAAAYRDLSKSASLTGAQQVKAAQLAELANAKLARSQGLLVGGMRGTSTGAKTAENDIGKLTRGALAGSGAASSLGRSLAFASTGFIAVAGTATILSSSIREALSFAATQKQVTAQLKTSGLAFSDYKDQIQTSLLAESKLSGFTRQDLLQSFGYLVRVSGNVGQSLRLDAVAADVARGRHIALSSASIALAKALGGSSTALRRLGIIVPKTLTGMAALNYVAAKFSGQAVAGATSADHLHASLANAGEIIGTVVLPAFNHLATSITTWLGKMEESGKLQKDATEGFKLLSDIFHSLEYVIKRVDDVTGSFAHTLQILIALELAKVTAGWITSLRELAVAWGLVGGAATKAAVAQSAALGAGEAGAAGAGGIAGLRALSGRRVFSVGSTGVATEIEAIGSSAAVSTAEVATLKSGLIGLSALDIAPIAIPVVLLLSDKSIRGNLGSQIHDLTKTSGSSILDFFKKGAENAVSVLQHAGLAAPSNLRGPQAPATPVLRLPQFGSDSPNFGSSGGFSPTPSLLLTHYWKSFALTFKQQQALALAALTKSNADDVAIARKIVADIRKKLAEGLIKGPAYFQALQLLAQELGVIESAATAAAQKAAAAAAAAKQKIITDIQNAIDPIKLQVALARAQASGQSGVPQMKEQLAAAYKGLAKAIASGNQQLILQAYQQIKSLKDAIKSAVSTTATAVFKVPAKLALDIARDQALGKGITDDLLQEKKALLKWISSHRKNIQGVTDAYNQIAAINSQLTSSVTSAYGDYKKASIKALTAGEGLTAAQRRELEARLSRVGPGGTTPEAGTGAAGYVIDPTTGRPVRIGHHNRRRRLQGSGYDTGTGPYKEEITVKVFLDGRVLAASTTVHQQRYRRGNPSSRRGPNAGNATA